MALPNSTTITQLAKVFEVDTSSLTPAAKKLTKGDLMRLNGTEDDVVALRKYAREGVPTIAEGQKAARAAKLALTVEDLHSIQHVFGSPRVPRERLAVANKAEGTHVYACCCPCCCATAVISPNRHSVM